MRLRMIFFKKQPYHGIFSDIIFSCDMLSDIHSDIPFGIRYLAFYQNRTFNLAFYSDIPCCDIYVGILLGTLLDILCDIIGILLGILSDILSEILFDSQSDIPLPFPAFFLSFYFVVYLY